MNFNAEEMELLTAFYGENRTETLEQMRDMAALLERVIPKVEAMSDQAYADLKPETLEVWDEL
jgi:hypothetical protein